MADHESRFDDELLSAYLDGELAPAERARVEARLASDPAARRLLDELRAVSQMTKELPQEKLGGDIRETILRRAERAMLISPAGETVGEAASAGSESVVRRGATSRITIGRSPRGWLWAGLAVAAALLLMVFQSEPEQDAGVPARLAARSDESSELTSEPAGRLELRAASETTRPLDAESAASETPPSGGTEIAATETPPSAGFEIATSSPSAPAAARPAGDAAERVAGPRYDAGAAAGEAVAHDESSLGRAAVAPTAGEYRPPPPAAAGRRESEFGTAAPVAGAFAESVASDADAADLVVVHLRMKPEALTQKVFDDTLVRNNITFEEPEPAPEQPLARGERSRDALAEVGQATGGIATSSTRSSGEPEGVEVVLVEAEPALIKSCLDEIDADPENFPGIAVEERSTPTKKRAAKGSTDVDWKQYPRGHVPQQAKLERADDATFYLQTERGPIVLRRYFGDEVNAPQLRTLAKEATSGLEGGRARRLQSLSEVKRQLVAPGLADQYDKDDAYEQSAADRKLGLARRGVVVGPKGQPDRLQVLFVLQAGGEDGR